MPIYKLAFLCVLLPVFSVHLTLGTAIWFDNLHLCNPYWRMCHSISATGRQIPEFFLFKGLMIPVAVLMMAYWLASFQWLKTQSFQSRLIGSSATWLLNLGFIACIGLVIYSVTLGAEGEPFALARRVGVILFFAFSAFAHLLLLRLLSRAGNRQVRESLYTKRLHMFCGLLLILGLVSALLGFTWSHYHHWDNAFEWWFAALLMGQFYQVGRLWQEVDFRLSFSVRDKTK